MKKSGKVLAKILEALGIAAVMLGLVQGLNGDMWGELYFFIGGIVAFYAGRFLEKRRPKTSPGDPKTN